MTRLALACTGTGFTLGVLLSALTGTRSCVSLSFVAGIGFATGVGLVAAWLTIWIGKQMGWYTVLHVEHSQPLDGPKDTSPY